MKRWTVIVLVLAMASCAQAQGSPILPYMSTFIRTVLDDATALAVRTTLGIGEGDTVTFLKVILSGNEINIATAQTPASAAAAGTQGDIAWDSGFLYVCVADNTWKRVAVATWGIPAEQIIYAAEDVIYAGEDIVYAP